MHRKLFTMLVGVICMMNCHIVFAAQNTEVTEGSYIQLGRYMGEPIIWRCIDIDENGKLMLSDNILCYKVFDARNHIGIEVNSERHGCGFWEESTLRTWLNATEKGGEIEWPGQNPPTYEAAFYAYDQEDGFLSPANFSNNELSVMKTVSQWQILGISETGKAENGTYFAFGYNYYPDKAYWFERDLYDNISELSHIEGAMYRLNDTMFLLNEQQVYNMWSNFGTISTNLTEYAKKQQKDVYSDDHMYWWLRTGEGAVAQVVYGEDKYSSNPCYPAIDTGVRPAFYLDERAAEITSGSGTEDDPYIINGTSKESITVYAGNERVDFDVEPIIENDRALVAMRAIFEELDADVEWDGSTSTVTAISGDTTVKLQIDSDIMIVNDEAVHVDAPARIVSDRTMVPLRAVSEALDADVEWIENLNRIVIDKPVMPMDFGEGTGKENWQTGKFGDWQPDMSKYHGGWDEYMASTGRR